MAKNNLNSDPKLSDFGYQQQLERSLSLKDLIIYGLIFMVPIAPFGIYGSVVSSLRHDCPHLCNRYDCDVLHRDQLRSNVPSLPDCRLSVCLCAAGN